MCSRCPERFCVAVQSAARLCGRWHWRALSVFVFAATVGLSADAPAGRVLRVAADPNNLPFSNDRGEGFENKIIALIARELGATVEYRWRAQRRGFFRETMKDGDCDLVAGVPHRFDPVLTTKPYYRSVYVVVQRTDTPHPVRSFDDPRLPELRIGVQMVGDDFANTPPAHALSRRGMTSNVRGFTLYGDYREPNPPARILDAVVNGDVDVAFVWGPLAGFFAQRHAGQLSIVPLPAVDPLSGMTMAFDISMGVRRANRALRDEVDAILQREKTAVDAILAEYGVPRLSPEEGQ